MTDTVDLVLKNNNNNNKKTTTTTTHSQKQNTRLLFSCSCGCFLRPPPQVFLDLVPAGSPSRGGDVAADVVDVNQPSLPTPFYSVLVSLSVFMALSTAFIPLILPTTLRFLTLFFRSYLCLIGPFNCISL